MQRAIDGVLIQLRKQWHPIIKLSPWTCPSNFQVIIANTQGDSIQSAAAIPAAAVYHLSRV